METKEVLLQYNNMYIAIGFLFFSFKLQYVSLDRIFFKL